MFSGRCRMFFFVYILSPLSVSAFTIKSAQFKYPTLLKTQSTSIILNLQYIDKITKLEDPIYHVITNSTVLEIQNHNQLVLANDGRNTGIVWAVVKNNQRQPDNELSITIDFIDQIEDCKYLTPHICFWYEVTYRANPHDDVLGPVTPEFYNRLCPDYKLSYKIKNGNNRFHVSKDKTNTWLLHQNHVPRKKKRRESKIEIECNIEWQNYNETHVKTVVVRFPDSISSESDYSSEESYESARRRRSQTSVTYPTNDIIISKNARMTARLAQPLEMKDLANNSRVKFKLETATVSPFEVTESGGILYLLKPELLLENNYSLNITWKGENKAEKQSFNIIVTDDQICDSKTSFYWCGETGSESQCLKSCPNTGNVITGDCQWRQGIPTVELSQLYTTCSSGLETCPDGFIDPLETVFPRLCPQDTAVLVLGAGVIGEGGRGIQGATTTCSCNENQVCTCEEIKKKQSNKISSVTTYSSSDASHSNVSWYKDVDHKKYFDMHSSLKSFVAHNVSNNVPVPREEKCGLACLLGLTGVGTAVVILFGSLIMIYKYKRMTKRCVQQETCKELTNINYEDCAERPLQSDQHAQNTHNQFDSSFMELRTEYYDKKWEFPRQRLAMEEILGEGEFGQVLKARAEGIKDNEGTKVVAVKTLKPNARPSELADLLSEYQLLKEVDHPNVIHLLGACTSAEGPVYIIIEFAEYGSLRNYLRRSRQTGSDILLKKQEDNESNYIENIEPITPRDVLTFAWQIAKGMAYLTDMKLVHRDLAARNVLLAEGKICKISDFGLTRDIYEDDTYLKRSKGRVPVKWMALESLADHIYTTKSDVWSFGIVLWELITIGASPYPGVAVQNLFHLLKSGYRMEKPSNCSPELYNILRVCWLENPQHRPTFKSLVAKFEEMLSEGRDYLDLHPRIIDNKSYFSDLTSDSLQFSTTTTDNNNSGEILSWRFDTYDRPVLSVKMCTCPDGKCICEVKLTQHKYENEISNSYVQPNIDHKPINIVDKTCNLYVENSKQEFQEVIKV